MIRTRGSQKTEVQVEKGLSGSLLSGALEWLSEGNPNESWAKRYRDISPEKQGFPKEFLEVVRKKQGAESAVAVSNLDIAEWYIDEGRRAAIRKKEIEDEQRENAIKQAKWIRNGGIAIILITLVLGGFALRNARHAKAAEKNLQLLDFVEILNYYNIISFESKDSPFYGADSGQGNESTFGQLHSIQETIANNPDIDENPVVLDSLIAFGVLFIDPSEKDLAYEALETIDKLYDDIKEKEKTGISSPSFGEILGIAKRVTPAPGSEQEAQERYGRNFRQYPFIYHALEAHIDIISGAKDHIFGKGSLSKYSKLSETIPKALISDLASSPTDSSQHALGDANGNVLVFGRGGQREMGGIDLPYIFSLEGIDAPVASLEYSTDGKRLFVGTQEGKVFQFDEVNFNGIENRMPSATIMEKKATIRVFRALPD